MVAEHGCPRDRGVWPPQEQTPEKICEQIADVHMPQVVEQTIEVPKMAEQILDVPVPEMVEQLLEVPETVSQDRIKQRTVEQIVDFPVPQAVQELAEVCRIFSQDRIQQRTVEQTIPAISLDEKIIEVPMEVSKDRVQQRSVEQIIENPAISLAEMIVEVPVARTPEKTQQLVNTHVQHVVDTVEVEKPEITELTVQRKEPIIQEKINQVTKPIEFPQAQFLNKVDDMLVDVQRQTSPMVQTVQKTIETPLQNKIMRVTKMNLAKKYLEILAEIAELNDAYRKFNEQFGKRLKLGIHENSVDGVEIAELLRFNTSKPGDEQISLKEYVDRMKEGLDFGEELKTESEPLKKLMNEVLGDKVEEMIVSNRMIDSLRVFTTSGHGLSANMERIMKAQAPRDDAMHIASGSQQQVEGREWETVVGKRRKKGERDQERRKKGKEREAEEGGSEQVKKDVTGWTEVTRKKRKKMVQIFVKMNESKVTPMEVSLEDDKVEDVMRQIQKDEDAYVTLHGRVLKRSDKLKSCGVTDGCTIQVTSRMRGGGKHKDKKGKEEKKKQVAQLDDGMCAMACEQMRQVMETLRTLADNSTGEDKRRVAENVEDLRKAIIGLRKQARGEELQRVAELEESLKKLEEEMIMWSVEEQEQRRQEEQEHAVLRKGKGKGNGGKGEHGGKGDKGGKGHEGTRKLRWADCEEEEEGVRQGAAEGEWHKARKEQGIIWLDGSYEDQEGHEGSAGGERCEVCGQLEVWSEESEEQEERGGQGGEGARQKMPSEEDEEEERTVVAPNTGAGGSHPRATTDPEEEVKEEEVTGEEMADEKPPGLEVVKSKQEEQGEEEWSQVKSEREVQEEEEQEEVKSEQEAREERGEESAGGARGGEESAGGARGRERGGARGGEESAVRRERRRRERRRRERRRRERRRRERAWEAREEERKRRRRKKRRAERRRRKKKRGERRRRQSSVGVREKCVLTRSEETKREKLWPRGGTRVK